jgi:hypothetical protein
MIEPARFGATGHESSRVIFGAAVLGDLFKADAHCTLEVLPAATAITSGRLALREPTVGPVRQVLDNRRSREPQSAVAGAEPKRSCCFSTIGELCPPLPNDVRRAPQTAGHADLPVAAM